MNATANQQLVSELTHETTLLTEIFDQIPSGLILVDRIGRIFKVNAAAIALLGEPLLGETWLSVIQRCFCIREDDGHEVSLRNGKRVKLSTQPLQNQPGQLVQITDLTETRKLQDQIGHMQRLSALGKMAATLAHQIRTPLSAAMLYGANLANKTLNQNSRSLFQQKLMARLQELECQVRDVLLFARNGEQQKVEEMTCLDFIDALQYRSEHLQQQMQVTYDMADFAQHDALLVNQESLLSSVMNLYENACEAGATSLLVTSTLEAERLLLRIVDNGKGIPTEQLSRIFEPFYTTRSNGTGLGLAVVQSVVKAHQGTIHVSSVVGEGTCFTIGLPLIKIQQLKEVRA